jgi:hypothetical protein
MKPAPFGWLTQHHRRLPEFLLTFTVYLGDTSCLLNSARLVSLF